MNADERRFLAGTAEDVDQIGCGFKRDRLLIPRGSRIHRIQFLDIGNVMPRKIRDLCFTLRLKMNARSENRDVDQRNDASCADPDIASIQLGGLCC